MGIFAGGRTPTLTALKTIEVSDLAIPTPAPDESLVKLRATGVCGTDLHLFEADWGFMPVVLGHDAVGEVVGNGQRVAIDPAISCRECAFCLAGRRNACTQYRFLGMTAPGAFASYLTLPNSNLFPMPDSMSDEAGTVLEPVCVALNLRERLRTFVTSDSPVLVVGGGPIGISFLGALEYLHEKQFWKNEDIESIYVGPRYFLYHFFGHKNSIKTIEKLFA